MKVKRYLKWIPILFVILAMLACNLPIAASSNTTDKLQAELIQTQTALANLVNSIPTATHTPENAAQLPSATFTIEPTITLTPTNTLTPTPEGVFLTVSTNTNCRTGPFAVFPYVTTIHVGDRVEVLGINPDRDTYYVRNPDSPSTYCWVWGQYATLTGNVAMLPVFTPQPTPTMTITSTPEKGFTVTYSGIETCTDRWALEFYIKNTGSKVWQSYQLAIYDTDTHTDYVHNENEFIGYTGCHADLTQGDLAPGEGSYVMNHKPGGVFLFDPTGHHFSVYVLICTLDNGGGVCENQTISVNP